MLKCAYSMKNLEVQAAEALRSLLEQVPAIKVLDLGNQIRGLDRGIDIVANIDVCGRRHVLACEVKSSGQPRHVRMALFQLREYLSRHERGATPVFIAPYLSPGAQALCRENDVGFLDLEGNARLVFDSVFIERQVANKPIADRRELKSLFKPKSAQVLRVLLRDPQRAWRVTELAQVAGVSLGHVSNVRVALLDREWAQVSDEGLFLSEPDALLDEWRDAYEPPVGKRLAFYTTLHGGALEEAARRVLRSDGEIGLAAFASFSAAHWLAPYARTGTQYFYADEVGLERLQAALKLSAISKGENVVVTLLNDTGLLRDTEEPAPGAVCTSPVQVYLDLANAGERGREAADHLRQERLVWMK
ncbi:type IV toxin-antitoxin system AbiEi family antitoxin [Burkholderia sp. LMU1-1-1.1]|uniref:type IV toxin-antitoxin system AbiEi family antitoxin n=1 Tax=Burkholderia sp. LMU1-1-1.1 TaxID=3135266 RepID=UPI003426A1F7